MAIVLHRAWNRGRWSYFVKFLSLGWGNSFLYNSRSCCVTAMKLYDMLIDIIWNTCTNFWVIWIKIVYFADQNIQILSKNSNFCENLTLTFFHSPNFFQKNCKNHFVIIFSVQNDQLEVFMDFGCLLDTLQTIKFDLKYPWSTFSPWGEVIFFFISQEVSALHEWNFIIY